MSTQTEIETKQKAIENYLDHLQDLHLQSYYYPQAIEKLFQYIDAQKEIQAYEAFFMGEKAFYQKNYEQALVHYMKADSVPYFEFFCIRTSAHISFKREEFEKAENFVDKALKIRPSDYPTLLLQCEILKKNSQQDEARTIEQKLDVLRKEVKADVPKKMITSRLIAHQLGVDPDAEKALEDCLQNFQQQRNHLFENYLKESRGKNRSNGNALLILDSWTHQNDVVSSAAYAALSEQSRQNSSGFFIRWNGRGIVVNPGPYFLENFHDRGWDLQDIHDVIVTKEDEGAYSDVKRLYHLNYQLNKISPEIHVIHYHLHRKAYQALSYHLKPNFKQERNSIHSLEMFMDSPDVEIQKLADGIQLHYFSLSPKGHFFKNADFKERGQGIECLGIRFDLTGVDTVTRRIGYLSGGPWSPLFAHHLGECDVLIAGFGTTDPNDYGKLHYHENSLGYYGTYSLLEEIKPQLLLCVEFDGQEGDIRLEVAKKLRKEYENAHSPSQQNPTILPAAKGFLLDLQNLQVGCTASQRLLDLQDVKVVKTSEAFGQLRYLSSTSIL